MRDLCHAGSRAILAFGPIGAARPACCNALVQTLLLLAVAAAAAAPPTGLEHEVKPQFGDLDAMLERRVGRGLVPYSRTFYFNARGARRGLTADTLRDFEVFLNKKYPKKVQPIVVVALPTTRDRMLS